MRKSIASLLLGTALTQHTRSVIFRRQATDLGDLCDRLLQIAGKRKMVLLFKQAKTEMIISHFWEKHVVQEADGDGRLQLQVVLSFVKLLFMQPGPVIENTLFVVAKSEHLHFHVELPAGLIAGLAAAVYPDLILWSATFLRDTLGSVAVVGVWYALVTATRQR